MNKVFKKRKEIDNPVLPSINKIIQKKKLQTYVTK